MEGDLEGVALPLPRLLGALVSLEQFRVLSVHRGGDTGGGQGELEPAELPTAFQLQLNLHIQHMHPPTINWVVAEVIIHSACNKQKGNNCNEYKTSWIHQ